MTTLPTPHPVLTFSKDGRATVKKGHKTLAIVTDRAVFYPAHNIPAKFSHPYGLEIPGMGTRECDLLGECIFFIEKYTEYLQ